MLPVAALRSPLNLRLCARIEQGRRINWMLTLSPSPPFSHCQCVSHILWCSIGIYFLFQYICTMRGLCLIRTTGGVSRQPKSGEWQRRSSEQIQKSARRIHLESAHKGYWRLPRRAPQTMNECGRGEHWHTEMRAASFPLLPFPPDPRSGCRSTCKKVVPSDTNCYHVLLVA